jgi:hypothetical protein
MDFRDIKSQPLTQTKQLWIVKFRSLKELKKPHKAQQSCGVANYLQFQQI